MPHIKLKNQRRTFERVKVENFDSKARTLEFSFSSEVPVDRWYGKEVLSHDKGAIDLSRFEGGANALFNHDWDVVAGVIEKAWVGDDKRGYVKVRFSKRKAAQEIMDDVEDGILKNVSFGYQIKEIKRQPKADDDKGPDTYLATKWIPFEVSFVTVPADHTVGVGRDLSDEEIEVPVIDEQNRELPTPPTVEELAVKTIPPQIIEKIAPTPAPIIEETKTITVTENKPKGTAMTPEEIKAMQEKMKQEERDRAGAVRALCEMHKMDGEFTRTLVDGGKSLEEARTAVLEKISTRQAPVSGSADSPLLGLSPKEVRMFSFVRAINALANPQDRKAQEAAKFEREVSEAGARARGKPSQGFYVPLEILAHGRRDLNVTTGSAGGDTVATNLVGFIEMLRKKSALQRAGATVLNGLVGNVAIPKQTGGATAYWVPENTNITTEGAQTFGQVALTPKGLGAYTDISRKLLLQSSIDIENLVRTDLATVVALEMDRAGLYGLGASNQPTGLTETTDINTEDFTAANPSYVDIVAMESAIAADDADVENMKYILNAAMRGALKTTEKFEDTNGAPIWEPNNTVNGYGTVVSNQVVDGDVFMGNWADFLIGFWSGIDILVDPYTGGLAGTLRLIALQDVDVAVRHPESFCFGNDDQ